MLLVLTLGIIDGGVLMPPLTRQLIVVQEEAIPGLEEGEHLSVGHCQVLTHNGERLEGLVELLHLVEGDVQLHALLFTLAFHARVLAHA